MRYVAGLLLVTVWLTPPCSRLPQALLAVSRRRRRSVAAQGARWPTIEIPTKVKPIDRFVPLLLSCALLLVCAFSGSGQESAQPRKFQTTYKIDMFAAPDVNAKKIGNVPADVILEAQEETQRYGGYIKVTYKSKTGYIFKAEVKRYMDVPAPELVCWSNGYKTIGGVYRYFFVLRNDGTLPYVGKIAIRLFDKDGKVVLEKTADYADGIAPELAGQFMIDTLIEAPNFELEHKEGKIKGGTGKLIERL